MPKVNCQRLIAWRGFTLIETIIYLALFTIIVGGGMVATYQVIEGTVASYNYLVLQEEANFLFRKINWALTGSTVITVNSSALIVSKLISGMYTQLTFAPDGTAITLQRTGAPVALNSDSIFVSNLVFSDIPAAGAKPRGITTSFTLTTAQNGRVATQSFSTTKYLRK